MTLDTSRKIYISRGQMPEKRLLERLREYFAQKENVSLAFIVSNVFKTGLFLTIKDKGLFWDLYLTKTLEAEDFYEFAKSYQDIYQRSKSLIPEDKTRLIERIQFLEGEFREIDNFENLTFED